MSCENQNGVKVRGWGTESVPSRVRRLLAWPSLSPDPIIGVCGTTAWDSYLFSQFPSHLFSFLCSYCRPRWQDLYTQLARWHPLRRLWEKPQTPLHGGTEPAGDSQPSRRLGSFWYVREERKPQQWNIWLQQKAEVATMQAAVDQLARVCLYLKGVGMMKVFSNSFISSFVSNLRKTPLPRTTLVSA